MFYAHLPDAYGMTPYVVHSTFQRYNNAGKVARFREMGAYLMDDAGYFTEGDFLAYDNLVLEYIEAMESLAHGNLTQVLLSSSTQRTCPSGMHGIMYEATSRTMWNGAHDCTPCIDPDAWTV